MKNFKEFKEMVSSGEKFFYTSRINGATLNWHDKVVKNTVYYPNYKETKENIVPDRTQKPYFMVKKPIISDIPIILEYIDKGEYEGNFRMLLTGDIVLKNIGNRELLLEDDLTIKEVYDFIKENPMIVNLKDIVPVSCLTTGEKEVLFEIYNDKKSAIYNKLLMGVLRKECQIYINSSKDVYKEILKLSNMPRQKVKTKA